MNSVYVGICGAPGTGKTTLLQHLQGRLNTELGLELQDIRHCASTVQDRLGYALDEGGSVETQFAVDAEVLARESELEEVAKIGCRTLLDGFAFAKANSLNMDSYYEALLPRLSRYHVLIYIPVESFVPFTAGPHRSLGYQRRVDIELRKLIRRYQIPVQVVKGNLELRTEIAVEAIKLRV